MGGWNLSRQKQNALIKAISDGASNASALAQADIAESTFYRWQAEANQLQDALENGSKKENDLTKSQVRFLEFWERVKKSATAFEAARLQIISEAAEGGKEIVEQHAEVRDHYDQKSGQIIQLKTQKVVKKKLFPSWQASAWLLERKDPQKWGRRVGVNLSLEDAAKRAGVPIETFKAGFAALVDDVAGQLEFDDEPSTNGSTNGKMPKE